MSENLSIVKEEDEIDGEETRPLWARSTPQELSYTLYMYSPTEGSMEELDIERNEYLSLKVRLAELRGFKTTEEELDRSASLDEIYADAKKKK